MQAYERKMISKKSILILLIVGFCIAFVIKYRNRRCYPISMSKGLIFEIPYLEKDKFYVVGINPEVSYDLDAFLNNTVISDHIDYTEILYDGDLQANSSINYIDMNHSFYRPQTITLGIYGNLNPNQVKAYFKR